MRGGETVGINLNMELIRQGGGRGGGRGGGGGGRGGGRGGRGGRGGGGDRQRRPRARQLTAKNQWSRWREMVAWTSNMASGVARQEGNCSATYIWHHMHVRRRF